MILQNFSTSQQPFVNDAQNPKFSGAVTSTSSGGSRNVTVTPPPFSQQIAATPPAINTEIGPIVPPPVTLSVTFTPPSLTYSVPTPAGQTIYNPFESVGIVQGNPKRLCALVRPNVVAGAHHYQLAGMTVRFIGANGTQDAVIGPAIYTKGDLELYRLDRAVTVVKPSDVAGLQTNYVNAPFSVFGLVGPRTGDVSNWIPAVSSDILKFAFEGDPVTHAWTATVSNKSNSPAVIEPGDSGAPCFFLTGNRASYLGSICNISLSQFQINVAAPWAAEIAAL